MIRSKSKPVPPIRDAVLFGPRHQLSGCVYVAGLLQSACAVLDMVRVEWGSMSPIKYIGGPVQVFDAQHFACLHDCGFERVAVGQCTTEFTCDYSAMSSSRPSLN
jgi:hypothetical protein